MSFVLLTRQGPLIISHEVSFHARACDTLAFRVVARAVTHRQRSCRRGTMDASGHRGTHSHVAVAEGAYGREEGAAAATAVATTRRQSAPPTGGAVTPRSAPHCWLHHEPCFGSNCWFRTCLTPRKRLCGALFSCLPWFRVHTSAFEQFSPTFGMHQKRLWKHLLRCTGP